ncbi:hypothetical protein OC845_005011 [Tilletia horrida]|nr:hypothetical protein OC845_005011 [Tilletia horrida]
MSIPRRDSVEIADSKAPVSEHQPQVDELLSDPASPSHSQAQHGDDDDGNNDDDDDDDDDSSNSPAALMSAAQYRRFKLAYSAVQFASGIAFSPFLTYVPFQLQFIAYFIGHEPGMPPGTGCSPTAISCRVPFAGHGDINLTSFINYINAISYAVSGALTLIVSGLGDRMSFQREQFIFFLFGYGALCLPFAGLTGFDLHTFNVYAGIYVTFNIFGFLVQVWGKIFIPYLMYAAERAPEDVVVHHAALETDVASAASATTQDNDAVRRTKREEAGLSMNLWGSNALNGSQILILLITLGVSYVAAANAGLYMVTAGGIVCCILVLAAGPFLPTPLRSNAKRGHETRKEPWSRLLLIPFKTFRDLLTGLRRYPEAFKYLLAYTIYTDTTFAFGSVTGQLFNLNIRPTTREYTAYSIVGPATSILVATVFVYIFPYLHRHVGLTLTRWTALAYGLNLFVAFWACIGISASASVGFKHRWEFYLMNVIQSTGGAIANLVFTVLFAQLFPRGHELEYFGFQLVLSCSTVWIPQIVNGPIVDATNNLRLPAIVSVATFVISVVLVLFTDENKGIRQIVEEKKAAKQAASKTSGGGQD